MSEVLEIDGSVLEGGGQILRISISLSAILGVPVRVTNIRAGRSKPGLAAQHLKGIQLVAEMCQARLKGAFIGSTEIEFMPSKIRGGHYVADTHTAGSISLLLQVSLPVALLADGPVSLQLRGGTNAEMAPQVDYMQRVFRTHLQAFGADFALRIHRRGYLNGPRRNCVADYMQRVFRAHPQAYGADFALRIHRRRYFPKGGGHVSVEVSPVRSFRGASLTEPGAPAHVEGESFVAGMLPISLAQQMSIGAKMELEPVVDDVGISCYHEDLAFAPDNCSGINLWCTLTSGYILGAGALARRGAEPTGVGRAAAAALCADIQRGACLDRHAQDQVIIYMALAEGKSAIRVGDITLHTRTAIFVAERIAKIKFEIRQMGEHQNIIECTGLGITNKHLPPA